MEKINQLTDRAKAAMTKLRGYKGCVELIRSALSDSKDVNIQRNSFQGITPNITEISAFYYLSMEIGKGKSSFLF